MKILQVNNVDIYGKSFNGYDITDHFNATGKHEVKQLVVTKFSDNKNVIPLYKDKAGNDFEYQANLHEKSELSVQSLISATSYFVRNNSNYVDADLVHFHQVHNTHLNLTEFAEMAKVKPTVISFHDPWFMTGRCVHFGNCEKWKSGCHGCQHLDTLFDFTVDNCSKMWDIKRQMFEKADVDVIVHSRFMLDIVKSNPYTKDLNVHLVSLGLDLEEYRFTESKEKARRKLGIPKNSIVLFFRAQAELKGTEYIVEALKGLETHEQIVLLTCSQQGLLKELEGRFKIIDLGNIDHGKVLTCFNACDIFLMPSIGESFGVMAIEAMASGKPVIIFDNTALPVVTFAPECGVLVKDRDSDDLREKIQYLISDPKERERRGELGRRLAEENYRISDFYTQIDEVYQKAYERQRYKLDLKYESDLAFDPSDPEVKKLLLKLHRIAASVFPYDSDFKCLSEIDYLIRESDEIDYSSTNVQKAIVAFNEEMSRKIESVDNAFYENSHRGIRKLKIYQWLKKSSFLKRAVDKVRRVCRNRNAERYNNTLLEMRKLELKIQELEKRINLLTERADNVDHQ